MAADGAEQNLVAEQHLEKRQSLRIGYVYSSELVQQCDRIPNLQGRVSIVMLSTIVLRQKSFLLSRPPLLIN